MSCDGPGSSRLKIPAEDPVEAITLRVSRQATCYDSTMRKTAFAFFMLALGAAAGLLVGFTVGSGGGAPANTVAAGWNGIPRTPEARTSEEGSGGTASFASSERISIEPSLEQLLAPVDVSVSSPSGRLIAELASNPDKLDSAKESSPAAADGTADPARSISGLVIDDQGRPLAGVTVTTVMNPESSIVRTRSADSIGQGWEGENDLTESLKSRAATEIARRRMRKLTVSDEEGRFTLTQLLPGRHSVYAYAKGYVFSNRRTYVGTSTTLTGSPAEYFHLEVVDEKGTPLEEAIIGVAKNDRWTYYDWTSEEPRLPLTERTAVLRAFAGGPLIGDSKAPFAKLASEKRRIHLEIDGDGPHRFEVKPPLSLCVTVVDQTTDGPTLPHSVRYASEEALTSAGGRSAFRRNSKALDVNSDGRYRIGSLKPGPYVLGVSRGGDEPEVFREFTVADGPIEETVVLPPVRSDEFWVVKAYSPNGVALSGLNFSLWTLNDNRVRSKTLASVERSRGEHWISRSGSSTTSEVSPRLVVKSATYGSLMTPVGFDQGEVRVDFSEPCELRVNVVADPDKTFNVYLKVRESLNGGPSRDLVSAGPKLVKGGAYVTFRGIQPALGQLSLSAESGSERDPFNYRSRNQTLALAEVPLRSGEQVATLSATTLHSLEIHAPDESPGTQFRVNSIPVPGTVSLSSRAYGRLSKDHTVRLTNLAAGRYSLSVDGNGSPSIEVTVPSSAISYERPATVGYRVSKRRERAIAPLVVGDIVTAVNGKSIAKGSFSSRLNVAVAEGETTLTLVRDGESMETTITSYPSNAYFRPVASLK